MCLMSLQNYITLSLSQDKHSCFDLKLSLYLSRYKWAYQRVRQNQHSDPNLHERKYLLQLKYILKKLQIQTIWDARIKLELKP
jgi:hypothetical protein